MQMQSPICWACRLSASWQPQLPRGMATMQKKQPSRMVLSSKVAQKFQPAQRGGKKPEPRTGPFGGMNVTEANIRAPRRPTRASSVPKRNFKGSERINGKSKPTKDPASFKALKMQRALAPVSYERRNEVKNAIEDRGSFNDYSLLPVVKASIGPQALRGRTDASPSPIQRLAIPALLGTSKQFKSKDDKMQQFLLAAETGSGKTLAYLLPIIDALKKAELKAKEEGTFEFGPKIKKRDALFELSGPEQEEPDPSTGRPKAIILVPTAELVDQVGSVVKSISHTVKFRAALLSANYSAQVIRNRLFSPAGVDIVISTPHIMSSIIDSDPNVVARVTHLVIDEADSLLDRSFSPITRAVLDRASPSMKQLILCSATIPRNLDTFLNETYPNIFRLTTPNLHAIPRRVQLSVVDIEGDPYRGNRNLACADTIWNIGRQAAGYSDGKMKLVVFVNERETTEEVAGFLKSKGIDAFALNRDASDRLRSEILAEFTGMPLSTSGKADKNTESSALASTTSGTGVRRTGASRLANVSVLVMTDIGSRGVDTVEVRNVLLYDVPHTSIDFIHRLGRVGRMGRRGKAVVLVGKGDRRDIVKEVRTGMFMGKALI